MVVLRSASPAEESSGRRCLLWVDSLTGDPEGGGVSQWEGFHAPLVVVVVFVVVEDVNLGIRTKHRHNENGCLGQHSCWPCLFHLLLLLLLILPIHRLHFRIPQAFGAGTRREFLGQRVPVDQVRGHSGCSVGSAGQSDSPPIPQHLSLLPPPVPVAQSDPHL